MRVAEKRTTVTSQEVLESSDFRNLVVRRWRVSLILTLALFIVYYGFILLVATQRGLLSMRVGEATTLGDAWQITADTSWMALAGTLADLMINDARRAGDGARVYLADGLPRA